MSRPPSLADFLSFELLADVARHRGSHPKTEDGKTDYESPAAKAWSETYSSQAGLLRGCLNQFLLALRESRHLQQVEHADGRGHYFSSSWNAFVTRKENEYTVDSITQFLSGGLFVHVSPKLDELQSTYDAIVRRCDAGNFEWFDFGSSSGDCQVTGQRLYLEMQGWVPVLGTLEQPITHDSKFVPVPALQPDTVSYHAINVPSGELLVADWFRLPAFSEAVEDEAGKRHEYSINNNAGKLRKTAWYAQAHGFMSVFVGNSLPSVVSRDGHTVIASVDEDDDGETASALQGEVKGYVCTDLWWATAIDKEVLTQLVAKRMPRAEAELAIEAMLEKTTHARVKVTPGILHVYHTAKPEAMQDFRSADVPHEGIEQLFAVLSEKPLSWTHKLERKHEASLKVQPTPTRRPRP